MRRSNTVHLVSSLTSGVTRLGDLLDFGQLFEVFGNNKFAQIFHFSSEIIFGHLLLTFGDFFLVTLAAARLL